MKLRYKIIAFGLVLLLTFQSLNSINSHTYSAGISNLHYYAPKGIICCFGPCGIVHSLYNCGQTFHIN